MTDLHPDGEPAAPPPSRYTATPAPVLRPRQHTPPEGQGDRSYRPPVYRPGSVTTACAITWGLLALYGYYLVRFAIGDLAIANASFGGNPGSHLPGEVSAAFRGFAFEAAVLLAWAVVAFVLSLFTYAGRPRARLALAISGGVSVPFQLGAFWFFLVPLVGGLATIAVIVALFTGDANEWYRSIGRDAQSRPR
ncbi:MAG: hypothetical protein JWQ32_3323 [Marmoricola sp.]|nr:hypothetical protein [Marmoricola sp.]